MLITAGAETIAPLKKTMLLLPLQAKRLRNNLNHGV